MMRTDQAEVYDVRWHAEELRLYAGSTERYYQRYVAIEKGMVARLERGMPHVAMKSAKRQLIAWYTTAARGYRADVGVKTRFTREAIEKAAELEAGDIHDNYQFGYYKEWSE